MDDADRRKITEDILASLPQEMGFGESAKSNLEEMTDQELRSTWETVCRMKNYARSLGSSGEGNITRRAAVARKRASAFKRMGVATAKLESARNSEGQAEQLASHKGALVLKTATTHHSYGDVFRAVVEADDKAEISHSIAAWAQFEANQTHTLITRLRKVVSAWLVNFNRLVLGAQVTQHGVAQILEGGLEGPLEAYFRLALDSLGRDTMRLMRNHLIHHGAQGLFKNERDAERLIEWLKKDFTLTNPAFDPVLIASGMGILEETRAIDGLAKLDLLARDFGCDTVISVAGGGEIVGEFLAKEGGTGDSRYLVLNKTGRSYAIKGGIPNIAAAYKVILVDDLAVTGTALFKARDAVRKLFPGAEVRVVALAGTAGARVDLVEGGDVYFPNVVAGSSFDLPWDRGGGYYRGPANHIFGYGADFNLPIRREQLKRVRSGLTSSGDD